MNLFNLILTCTINKQIDEKTFLRSFGCIFLTFKNVSSFNKLEENSYQHFSVEFCTKHPFETLQVFIS